MAERHSSAQQLRADQLSWLERIKIGTPGCFDFSPEWDAFHEPLWAEYDGLERRRQHLGLEGLPWQEPVKKYREECESGKKYYQPLEGKLFEFCPLQIRLDRYSTDRHSTDRYIGPGGSGILDAWKHPWRVMLDSWAKFQELYDTDVEFRSYLSPFQRNSYLLLRDWWYATYCDPYFPTAAQFYFESQEGSTEESDPRDPDALEKALGEVKGDKSLYHAACFGLFLREFHPRTFQPYACLRMLREIQARRFIASGFALAQRFSFSALFPNLAHALPNAGVYPIMLIGEMRWSPDPADRGHPTYLWDSEQMRTVVVSDLPQPPDYTCISHTWGRWRRRDTPAAKIPGVPWEVPRNSRFNVEDLPVMLRGLNCRFVWIDLLCIPQDNPAEADEEIGRQAHIFRGCRECVAWFSDVESWDGMKKALRWLGLYLLRAMTRPYGSSTDRLQQVTDEEFATATAAAGSTIELLQTDNIDDDNKIESNPWFSSLWTLQEALLCPNLTLCSRDWARLTDEWGAPVSLETLVAIIDQACKLQHEPGGLDAKEWPRGPRRLNWLDDITQLYSILVNRSPSAVCTGASLRYCELQNRAPAIMSALGVVEWHKKALPPPGPPGSMSWTHADLLAHGADNRDKGSLPRAGRGPQEPHQLVFGMYPLPFLEEVHEKFGAHFFSSVISTRMLKSNPKEVLMQEKAIGSMLPFAEQQGLRFTSSSLYLDTTHVQAVDHNSVSKWRICRDGSVEITGAGIVASSLGIETAQTVHGLALWVGGPDGLESEQTEDIGKLLRRIAGSDFVAYAVALFEDGHLPQGNLLYGLRPKDTASPSRQYLVKVGYFLVTEGHEMPNTTPVDWVVL